MRLIDADALNVRRYCRWFDDPDDIRVVERMIREAPTIAPPPNDPLTLEELREMDGDKIYVHYIDGFYADEDGAYFGKFEELVRECEGRLTACELPLKYYGKTWLAYYRKPEEV